MNHHNDGESHEVAMRNLILACVHLIVAEPGRGLCLRNTIESSYFDSKGFYEADARLG